ncbi:serine hydrolase FSH [Chaetomium strumarium]|uniref:Serine hydrolase FSH n=1 Tax=Chaetomium strumarium TaxID=1170767 RepID=A0AAJ0H4J8_9PEZI|nr:serine hydrolase FSH [Chaetomium strumarium]
MGDAIATPPSEPSAHPPPQQQQQQRPPKKKNAAAPAKKEVRILMLHGYTQSGPLFRAKTRALEKLLAKALAPAGLVPALLYPTAPTRLSARDIPGFDAFRRSSGDDQQGEEGGTVEEEEMDAWAWFRHDRAAGRYKLVEEGMVSLAKGISEWKEEGVAEGEEGGGVVDGVLGFSQGGCVAGMLAAALEEGRTTTTTTTTGEEAKEHEGWVRAVREANGGRPLKFAVVYSGFWATPADLGWLYEPKIRTPTLHVLGSLDTVVEESRSQGLVERCEDPLVLTHPGGHYVPVNKEWVMPVAGFIKKCVESAADATKL